MKLIEVAQKGESIQLAKLRESDDPMATPSIRMAPIPTPSPGLYPPGSASGSGLPPITTPINSETTEPDNTVKLVGSPFLEQHNPSAAKCAVPLAMSLMAAVEFIGALLDTPDTWHTSGKFGRSIDEFFKYAGITLDPTEKAVLKQSFRNGMAHNFMMQGKDVAIDYQKRFELESDLLFVEDGQVILNVNRLQKIVFEVFDKIVVDESIYATVVASVTEYETGKQAKKTEDLLQDFKAFYASR